MASREPVTRAGRAGDQTKSPDVGSSNTGERHGMEVPVTQTQYDQFLASKAIVAPSLGVNVPYSDPLHPDLFDFQRACTRWAIRKGRGALFEPPGTGKTFQGCVWARYSGKRILSLAPLGVARQTEREGERWGIPVVYARSMAESPSEGITLTNYEMASMFDPDAYDGVWLDESSILKDFASKTRTLLIEMFRDTPRKLCTTATPAPNDIAEMANHAEFLGVMTREEMLATFFVHDENGWRLKGYARDGFYRWLASIAMSLNRPSDLGLFSDEGYELPPLTVTPVTVKAEYRPRDQLFAVGLKGIQDRSAVRKETVDDRVRVAAELIQSEAVPWIAWVGRNDEGRKLANLIPDAVLIEGSQSPDEKAAKIDQFQEGQARVVISKCSITGQGLNWQHCTRQVFVGLSDSWEVYYQAIRRSWRFGVAEPVHVYVVVSEPEQVIYENILRKEREATRMTEELIRHVALYEQEEIRGGRRLEYAATTPMESPAWLA